MLREALVPLVYDAQHGCFGCGDLNPSGLRLRFFHAPERSPKHTPDHTQEHSSSPKTEAGVICLFRMPRRFQGPHGFSHGGMIATVLDEAMSKAIHASPHAKGLMAMTRHIEVDYQRPVPLATPLVLRAHHGRVEGRKHFCEGTLEDAEGHVLAKGKSLFIAIPREPEHKH